MANILEILEILDEGFALESGLQKTALFLEGHADALGEVQEVSTVLLDLKKIESEHVITVGTRSVDFRKYALFLYDKKHHHITSSIFVIREKLLDIMDADRLPEVRESIKFWDDIQFTMYQIMK